MLLAIRSIKQPSRLNPDLNVIVITGYPDSEILDQILKLTRSRF